MYFIWPTAGNRFSWGTRKLNLRKESSEGATISLSIALVVSLLHSLTCSVRMYCMPLASNLRFSFDRTDGICTREELDESQIMSSFSKLQAPAALSGNLPSSNFEFNQEFSKLLLDYIYITVVCKGRASSSYHESLSLPQGSVVL